MQIKIKVLKGSKMRVLITMFARPTMIWVENVLHGII